jgi:uncharacterized membrane protein YqjE
MDSSSPEAKLAQPQVAPGFSASLLRYVEARGVLLSLEAQEAVGQVLKLLIFAIVGGIACFTGWLLVSAVLVGLLMDQAQWSLLKAAAIVGGAHLLLGIIFFSAVINRISSTRWFADTLNELKKDRTWLAEQTAKH